MALGEVLREFGVKIAVDFDGKKLEEAHVKVQKFGAELKSFALQVTGLTAGLLGLQNNFTSHARSVENAANVLGMGTEALQDYQYAAKVLANANEEDVNESFRGLAETVDQFRAGNTDAASSLIQLATAAAGPNGAQAFMAKLTDTATPLEEKMRMVSEGIQKSNSVSAIQAERLTSQVLGSNKLFNALREGPNVLKKLTDEGRKNYTLNDRMIKQGAEMDKQLSRIWLMFRKMGYEIGFATMKYIGPLVMQFKKWFDANHKLIVSGIVEFVKQLASALQGVWEIAIAVAAAIIPIIKMMGGMHNVVKLLIGGFLAFKAINFAAALYGIGVALAPLLPMIAAISAAVVVLHDAMALFQGAKFSETFIGKGIGKIGSLISGAGPGPLSTVNPVGPAAPAPGGGYVLNQDQTYHQNLNFYLEHGGKVDKVIEGVKKGVNNANDLQKSKADANGRRKS
jgi:hypothetical protein